MSIQKNGKLLFKKFTTAVTYIAQMTAGEAKLTSQRNGTPAVRYSEACWMNIVEMTGGLIFTKITSFLLQGVHSRVLVVDLRIDSYVGTMFKEGVNLENLASIYMDRRRANLIIIMKKEGKFGGHLLYHIIDMFTRVYRT